MIQKAVERIEKSDIESLVTDKIGEHKTLEYKLQLPGSQTDDKREFLYDVAALANAAGGDIIFGIADERDSSGRATGIPAAAEGVNVENISREKQRIEHLVRDGIDPRIPGITFQQIDGFTNGPVLVMRIPKSWISPHMVTFGGVSRFYSRNNAGKYPLNAGEIRSAFLASSAVGERLRQFRLARIAKAIEDDLPIPLSSGLKLLLHLIPLSALDPSNMRDVASETAQKHYVSMTPVSDPGAFNYRYNFDGWLGFASGISAYVQLFRSGAIEAGEGALHLFRWTHQSRKLPVSVVENALVAALTRFLSVQKELAVPLPIALMLTLVGVKGFSLIIPQRFSVYSNTPIDRDILQFPEVMVDDYDRPAHVVLRPVFDALWQSGGFEKSLNYDDNGDWKARD